VDRLLLPDSVDIPKFFREVKSWIAAYGADSKLICI